MDGWWVDKSVIFLWREKVCTIKRIRGKACVGKFPVHHCRDLRLNCWRYCILTNKIETTGASEGSHCRSPLSMNVQRMIHSVFCALTAKWKVKPKLNCSCGATRIFCMSSSSADVCEGLCLLIYDHYKLWALTAHVQHIHICTSLCEWWMCV